MEFSMEVFTQDLQCRVLETPFPSIGNYQIFDDVNPGISKIFKITHNIRKSRRDESRQRDELSG